MGGTYADDFDNLEMIRKGEVGRRKGLYTPFALLLQHQIKRRKLERRWPAAQKGHTQKWNDEGILIRLFGG